MNCHLTPSNKKQRRFESGEFKKKIKHKTTSCPFGQKCTLKCTAQNTPVMVLFHIYFLFLFTSQMKKTLCGKQYCGTQFMPGKAMCSGIQLFPNVTLAFSHILVVLH